MKSAHMIKSMSLILLISGCTFNFEITSQRTALENQVMGVYQELDDEVLLLSTMRSLADGEVPSKKMTNEELEHKRNQQFNRDDIEEMKDRGWIGERRDGHLSIIEKNFDSSIYARELPLIQSIIKEENRDREVIWAHILKRIANGLSYGIRQVGQAYGDMQRSKLSLGQWYEDEKGTWRIKSEDG